MVLNIRPPWSPIQRTLPLGFLSKKHAQHSSIYDHSISSYDDESMMLSHITWLIRKTDPLRWPEELSDSDITKKLSLSAVFARLTDHCYRLTEILRAMLSDVAFQITPVTMNLSLFRSQVSINILSSVSLISFILLR